MIRKFLLFGFLILQGCTLLPTKVREGQQGPRETVGKVRPLVIDEKTVLLDARPFFNYGMGHVPNAISVNWEDFSDPQSTLKGRLDPNLRNITRRLASWGIAPESRVVVLGNGLGGHGEEGRVAWMLKGLGVRDVAIVQEPSLRRARTQNSSEPKSVPVWEPLEVAAEWQMSKRDIRALVTQPDPEHVVFIDVRTRHEYMSGQQLELNALNVPWEEFLTEDGRPNPRVVKKLMGVGVVPEKRIVVLSRRGVRAGLVAHVLNELGYPRVFNVPGGLEEIEQQ